MRTYGQFCPIARASELLAERWTPIIIRNLLTGCRTFTEIRQGAPGISTALLAQRLDTLVRHGVVEATPIPSGRGSTYALTEKGLALKPVCDAIGQWGARWLESGRLTLAGPPRLAHDVLTWIRPSPFAPYLPERTR